MLHKNRGSRICIAHNHGFKKFLVVRTSIHYFQGTCNDLSDFIGYHHPCSLPGPSDSIMAGNMKVRNVNNISKS